METKRKPPNPNGNPNFRSRWDKLGETSTVRLPQALHSTFKNLASAINEGKIKITDLAIVPDPIPKPELLDKLEQFEAEQAANWGTNPNQRGEFKTSSRSWDKYHEFKAWVQNHDR